MRTPDSYYQAYYAQYPWGRAYHDWIQRNPLRRWRHEKQWESMPDGAWRRKSGATSTALIAHRLGVWTETMFRAERGEFIPTDERLASLALATGIPDLADQWRAWLREFPREIPLDGPDAPRLKGSVIRLQRLLRAA